MSILMKHLNIGATVVLLQEIHKLTSDEGLPGELVSLFDAEAKMDCDFRKEGGDVAMCGFNDEEKRCMVANCPLGALSEQQMKELMGGK